MRKIKKKKIFAIRDTIYVYDMIYTYIEYIIFIKENSSNILAQVIIAFLLAISHVIFCIYSIIDHNIIEKILS